MALPRNSVRRRSSGIGVGPAPEKKKSRSVRAKVKPSLPSFDNNAHRRQDLVRRVEGCILGLVRKLLGVPDLQPSDNLIDHGATSLTAMLLLGKLRSTLAGVLEGAEIRGLKLAIVKERLWGSSSDLARGVCGVDVEGRPLPEDPLLECDLRIDYCGG